MSHLTILLVSLAIAAIHGTDFHENEMTTGLMHIKMGAASISREKWNIMYYYNLEEYFKQIELLEDITTNIEKTCDLQTQINRCEILLNELRKYNEKNKRSQNIINKFRTNGQERPNTTTTDSSSQNPINNDNEDPKIRMKTKLLSKIYGSIKANNDRIKQLITELNEMKSHFSTNVNSIEGNNQFNQLVDTAIFIIMNHNHITDSILQLLTDSSTFKLIEFIPTETFEESLRNISLKLPKGKKLPIEIERENIYDLFAITEISTKLIKNELMIVLSIPVINEITYNLYKIIPLPTKREKDTIIIQPSQEYVLVNKAASHYIPLSTTEHINCLRRRNDYLICSPNNPTYTTKFEKCEFYLFEITEGDSFEEQCKFNIRSIQEKNYFIELFSPNYYYVHVKNQMTLRVLCKGREPEEMIIMNSGILEIDNNCIAETNGISIETKSFVENENLMMIDLQESDYTKLKNRKIKFDQLIKTNDATEQIEKIQPKERKVGLNILDFYMQHNWKEEIISALVLAMTGTILYIIFYITYKAIRRVVLNIFRH